MAGSRRRASAPAASSASGSAAGRSATCTATTSPTSASPRTSGTTLLDQGRIDYHPVFPGKPGYGARRIESEDDIRDVIELLRLNYDRVVARHGVPAEAA